MCQLQTVCLQLEVQFLWLTHTYNADWGRGHQKAIFRLLCLGFFSPACSRSSSQSWCQPPRLSARFILDDLFPARLVGSMLGLVLLYSLQALRGVSYPAPSSWLHIIGMWICVDTSTSGSMFSTGGTAPVTYSRLLPLLGHRPSTSHLQATLSWTLLSSWLKVILTVLMSASMSRRQVYLRWPPFRLPCGSMLGLVCRCCLRTFAGCLLSSPSTVVTHYEKVNMRWCVKLDAVCLLLEAQLLWVFYYFSSICSSFSLALSFQFKVKEQIHCGIEYLLWLLLTQCCTNHEHTFFLFFLIWQYFQGNLVHSHVFNRMSACWSQPCMLAGPTECSVHWTGWGVVQLKPTETN